MSVNPDQATPQVIYQQQGYPSYQTPTSTSVGTWGQTQPQSVSFAIPYQTEVNSYADKAGYVNSYPPLHFNGTAGDSEYYRQPYSAQFHAQPSNQWSQQGYQSTAYQQTPYGNYSTLTNEQREAMHGATFNPGAPPPNMNRPPPIVKRENGDSNFHNSLSMLENSAHTAAAYTASWVSSTSSIPPELKDEPEFATMHRDEMGGHMFTGNFQEQFNNMAIHDKSPREMNQWDSKRLQSHQWPGLGQQEDSSRNKKNERDRRPNEDARELTWDERLRKAQVQKERVEHKESERMANAFVRQNIPRGGRGGRGTFRGNDGRDSRPRDGAQWKEGDDRYFNIDQARGGFRGGRTFNNGRGMIPNVPSNLPPNMFPGGQNSMIMPPGAQFLQGAPPPHLVNLPQDERFKNTWLDANAFHQPFYFPIPNVPFTMDRFGNRGGRGRGQHRGNGRGGMTRRESKKDTEVTNESETKEDENSGFADETSDSKADEEKNV